MLLQASKLAKWLEAFSLEVSPIIVRHSGNLLLTARRAPPGPL
jgi:hypothetical protein